MAASESVVPKPRVEQVAPPPPASIQTTTRSDSTPVTLTGPLPVVQSRNSPFKLTVNSPILPKPGLLGDGTAVRLVAPSGLVATPVTIFRTTAPIIGTTSPHTPVQVVAAISSASWNKTSVPASVSVAPTSGSIGINERKRKFHQDGMGGSESAGGDLTSPAVDLGLSVGKRARRNSTEKGNKGLRHFSMKVCEKVQQKGVTTYNEVADELVKEFVDPMKESPDQTGDQKNIRRRVYDALNVLMAMNIISKEKKEIRWIGLPTNSAQECVELEQKKQACDDRIKQKTRLLEDLIIQQVAFMNLVKRNKEREQTQGVPSRNTSIQLPFIVVNTGKKTVIDCKISNDKSEYTFDFDNAFEIHDDIEVLKRMGMAFGLENASATSEQLLEAQKMIPKQMHPVLEKMAKGPESPIASRQGVPPSPLAQPLGNTPSSPSRRPLPQPLSTALTFSPLQQSGSPRTSPIVIRTAVGTPSPSPVALSSPVVVSTPMATHTYARPMPVTKSPVKIVSVTRAEPEVIDVIGDGGPVENGKC